MRAFVALLLTLVVACSSAPAPTRCTPGASVACVCPGVGTGAQVCAADGASYGACACGVDAGTQVDVATSSTDAALDAPTSPDRPEASDVTDAPPADDGRDPRCGPGTLVMCLPGSCWDLQTSNGRIPATHCGACGNACPGAAPECVGGRCTVRTSPADAGR